MACKIAFSLRAQKDIYESVTWYEEQQIGLGDRFVDTIDAAFNTISLNPEAFLKKKNQLRQMPVSEFPYVIVYKIENEHVVNVLRVFHTSRNPKLKFRK